MTYQRLEILTEEKSMEYFLRGLLPRILPKNFKLDENCFIRPHEGKSDLMRSIPHKISAYQHFEHSVKVLIIHDQDSNDCKILKRDILSRVGSGRIPYLIRIVCRELENWYLGDLDALEKIYSEINATKLKRKSKYRNPDKLFGADELNKLIKTFSKTEAARKMGEIISITQNRSTSFNRLISGVHKLITT